MDNINLQEEKYKIAFAEIDDILYFTDDAIKSKIPTSFFKFIKQNKDINHINNINPYLSIEQQEVSDEAKAIMALIYRSYIASDEEKSDYQKKDKFELDKIEKEKNLKYNPENIFKNQKSDFQKVNEDSIEYKESNLVVNEQISMIKKIKDFFRKIFLRK